MRAGSSFSPWLIHERSGRGNLFRVLEGEIDGFGEGLCAAIATTRSLCRHRSTAAARRGGTDSAMLVIDGAQ
jgi:hypothetical protein